MGPLNVYSNHLSLFLYNCEMEHYLTLQMTQSQHITGMAKLQVRYIYIFSLFFLISQQNPLALTLKRHHLELCYQYSQPQS